MYGISAISEINLKAVHSIERKHPLDRPLAPSVADRQMVICGITHNNAGSSLFEHHPVDI